MPISDTRRQFIADIANDEWIDRLSDEERDDATFDAISAKMDAATDAFLDGDAAPEELHLFAELWNRDGGVESLMRVVTHAACDAGTALMVYWRTRPEWFVQFASMADVAETEKENFELIETIERRYLADGYVRRAIPYDPKADAQIGLYPDALEKAKRKLPDRMYVAVP